ncbi:hypothetical protein J437_LFUL010597 [Ladona fulva]|uniref:Uncharacterized protein n=1 Tax=Ladona fulva TaxID=123851 RepID=A0A8K0KAK6_LADFU|nr:hypothetical protein J437_LFUL010597 [Ladona fulva]
MKEGEPESSLEALAVTNFIITMQKAAIPLRVVLASNSKCKDDEWPDGEQESTSSEEVIYKGPSTSFRGGSLIGTLVQLTDTV